MKEIYFLIVSFFRNLFEGGFFFFGIFETLKTRFKIQYGVRRLNIGVLNCFYILDVPDRSIVVTILLPTTQVPFIGIQPRYD